MVMSRVVGIVCEGPTDYEVIWRVVDLITQAENVYHRLQPDESLTGQFGNGWKGVWKWCERYGPILETYMRGVAPQLDFLIVHMDGDVSRREKEVHCACETTCCELVGTVHPLHCPVCKSGKCPVDLPCVRHENDGYAPHLKQMISAWLCLSAESSPVIITIPCDSIDTWVAVSFGDLGAQCEAQPDPWNAIIAKGAYYHDVRMRGRKKRVSDYRAFAANICANWGAVKKHCSQAQVFEDDVRAVHKKWA